jgi:hypothetical protein
VKTVQNTQNSDEFLLPSRSSREFQEFLEFLGVPGVPDSWKKIGDFWLGF